VSSLSLYEASIPVYLRMLRNLGTLLDKAEAHAAAGGTDVPTMLEARLAPDMQSLTGQIQLASDAAKGGAARLAGLQPPSFPDVEKTLPELRERLAKTIAFVETIRPEQVDGGEDRQVVLPLPNKTFTFTGRSFLFDFSLPNFLFHVVTAYGLLRAQGVPLGKLDYLAGGRGVVETKQA
jgi:hypothetical protein